MQGSLRAPQLQLLQDAALKIEVSPHNLKTKEGRRQPRQLLIETSSSSE